MGELAVLSRQAEDALQRGQLPVDLAVRDLPLLTVFTLISARGAPPPLARARRLRASRGPRALAKHDHIGAPLQNERVDVGRCDRREPAPAEVRQEVQANAPLEFVRRPPAVDGVFGLQIFGGLIEANPIQHGVHRQPMRDVAFPDLQQLNRVRFFGAAARLSHRTPVTVVLDPPDSAALVRHAHCAFSPFLVSVVVP
jgi:hypothetical protein